MRKHPVLKGPCGRGTAGADPSSLLRPEHWKDGASHGEEAYWTRMEGSGDLSLMVGAEGLTSMEMELRVPSLVWRPPGDRA